MLLFFVASIFVIKSTSSEWINCESPTTFTVGHDNNQIFVYDADIAIKYDRNKLSVYKYPDTDVVNVLINDTVVSFSGHVIEEHEEYDPVAFKLSRTLNTKITGSARLMKSLSEDNLLTDCEFYMARNLKENDIDLEPKVQIEILHHAIACIRSSICMKLGKITNEDVKYAENNPYAFGPLAVKTKEISSDISTACGSQSRSDTDDLRSLESSVESLGVNKTGLQSTINMLVDLAILEIVKKFREENNGSIRIPDISQRFSENSVWKPHGEFDAINGFFSDLTTLSRTEDASLSHQGLKFVASCGFGLSRASISYEKYKLRYGIIRVSGKLSATIDGVKLATTVSVDYNQKPCKATLQDLQVTELGIMKIKLTGLGPLNKLTSKLVTWITKKWKEDIIINVEQKVRNIVEQHLSQFNCEKYRP